MQKHLAVDAFVEFLMSKEEASLWRSQLIQKHIFTEHELASVSDKEVALIQRALLMQRYVGLTHTQFMQEVERHQFNYSFDMDGDEYRVGALCY